MEEGNSYFNTTHIEGEELSSAINMAELQDEQILKVFAESDGEMTPCEVWKELNETILITSVRRSITTLTGKGKLIKTHNKKIGIHGRAVYTWKLDRS